MKFFAFLSALLFACAAHAQTVTITKNVPYSEDEPTDARRQMDLYRPVGASNAPILVFLFGGALTSGEKASYAYVGNYFAKKGFLVAVPNYRLSPAVSHPEHAEDVALAIAWLLDNAATRGGNPDKLSLLGHSAGGYLATLIALDGHYLTDLAHDMNEIDSVVSISGFYHVDRVAPGRPKNIWGTNQAVWALASPAHFAGANAHPTLLEYASGNDEARKRESVDFRLELVGRGAQNVKMQQFANRTHTSIISQFARDVDPATQAALAFLNQFGR